MSATLPPGFQLDAPAPAAPNAPAAALPPGFRLDAPAEGLPGPRRTWGDVPADMMQNLPVSAQRFYGGVVEAIMDPLETIKNFADLAAGGLRAGARAVLPRGFTDALDRLDNPETTARISGIANAVGGEYAKNYGSVEGIRDKIATDPVGFASDMSLLLTGGGAAAAKAGAVRTAGGVRTAARYTDPLTPVIAPIAAAGRGAAAAVGVVQDMSDPMARAYREAAAGQGPAIVSALRDPNAVFVPGSRPLTSELAAGAGSAEFAAFARMGEERLASELAARQAEQSVARQSYLGQVAGAPANPVTGRRGALEVAEEARGARAGAAYRQAETGVVQSDATIERILERPSARQALQWAESVAKEKDQAFTIQQATPGGPAVDYTVRDLDRVQKALRDYVKENPQGLGIEQRNAILSTRADLLSWLDSRAPAYKAAREGFAQESGPINRMAVGREIQNALTNPLTGEASRATAFATATENAPRTIKRATGESRFSYLSDVLQPAEIKIVQDVARDLRRADNARDMISAGRRGDVPDISRAATEAATGLGPQVSLLNRAYTVANNIYRRLEGKVNRETAERIARDLMDPQATAFQLDRALRQEAGRAKVRARVQAPFDATAAALRNPASRVGAQIGNAMNPYEDPFTVNAFAP